jgi:hypothetical protein
MNGRIYDPTIGRFMSADPFIQAPYELQSHNRYAYVMNNPLLFTDPSGYWSWKSILITVVVIVATVYTMGAASAWAAAAGYGAVGSAVIAGAAAGFVGGFLGTALNGGSLSQSLKAGLIGGITGAAFGYVGGSFRAGSLNNYLGHAVVGCVSAVATAGKCGQGAASAVIGKWATNNTGDWGIVGRGVAATIAGGATSSIAGGRFADGARTAAFGYLFNEVNTAMKAEQYHTNSFHEFSAETKICEATNPSCNLDNLKPIHARLSYPGTTGVELGDYKLVNLGFVPGGFITQKFSEDGLTVYNITTPIHFLDPGYAVRTLEQRIDGIYIQTIGVGWGNMQGINNFLGARVIFPQLDMRVKIDFCSQYRGCR